MSLNGLDAPAVQEAYQHAIADSGGWLLLKYINRDSVELYDRGKGGVNEARVSLSEYTEQSPLYGLIIYRRRKVLIKYVPSGTSRLLQARTAVHFQDVMERYSPYETLLEFTSPEGLSDTALAAVFPLHTASPAISSNRLNEISEDAEDGASPPGRTISRSSVASKGSRERRAERAMRSERPRPPPPASSSPPPSIRVNGESSPTASPLASPKSTISQFLVREESGHRSMSSLTTPSIASVTEYAGSERSDTNTEPESAPLSKTDLGTAASTSSASPLPSPSVPSITSQPARDTSSVEEPSPADITPPAVASAPSNVIPETRRPTGFQERPARTEERASIAQSLKDRNDAVGRPSADKPTDDDPYDLKKYDYLFKPKPKLGPRLVTQDTKKPRPAMPSVAAVPSNVKPQPPRKDVPTRPKSHGPTTMPISHLQDLPAPPPIPDMPEYNPRPLSRGSIKSLPSHKSTSMTPDKLRLMKAIELRKKQMRKSQGAEMTGVPKFDADVPEVPKVPEQPPPNEAPRTQEEALGAPLHAVESPSKKADSGIEMEGHDRDRTEDKRTLELLESPPKVTGSLPDKPDDTEQPSSPSPVAETSAELTPKAVPVTPIAMAVAAQNDVGEKKTAETEAENGDGDILQVDHARVPTLMEPAIADNAEPSLDERQVFGDDPDAHESDGDALLAEPPRSPRRQNSDLAKRRRGYIEPLHLEDTSSDDEFAEELRTATVHEARPITVAKSPIMESFIRRPSYANSAISEASDARTESARQRSPSVPTRHMDPPDGQSVPSAEASPSAEWQDPMANLKRNVSSGISRRIQALADNSGRESSPHGYSPQARPFSPEQASGGLFPGDRSLQNRGSLRPPRSRTSSFQKAARLSARLSASQQSNQGGAMYKYDNAPVVNVHRDPATNRDSVSVTARIVRQPTSDERSPSEDTQEPPASADDRPLPTETMAELTRLDTSAPPMASQGENFGSLSHELRQTSPDHQTRALHSSRNHFGRHKQASAAAGTPLSPHADDFPAPPVSAAPRTQSSTSLASANEDNSAPKEGTRTSRFFKRMSNIATKRRSAAQGSSAGDSVNSNSEQTTSKSKSGAASRDGERSAEMPPAISVGNLNVQFPDSLLWKRRIVSIDDSGHLCFAVPQAMEHQRGSARKYALGEFRMPFIPDLDRQELPYSVMLDFADGTTLQAACEDAMTHRQVVHVLKSYWRAWQGQ